MVPGLAAAGPRMLAVKMLMTKRVEDESSYPLDWLESVRMTKLMDKQSEGGRAEMMCSE